MSLLRGRAWQVQQQFFELLPDHLFCLSACQSLCTIRGFLHQFKDTLAETGNVNLLDLRRGHNMEVDEIRIVEVGCVEGQGDQAGIGIDQFDIDLGSKIIGLCARKEQAASDATGTHNGAGDGANFVFCLVSREKRSIQAKIADLFEAAQGCDVACQRFGTQEESFLFQAAIPGACSLTNSFAQAAYLAIASWRHAAYNGDNHAQALGVKLFERFREYEACN